MRKTITIACDNGNQDLEADVQGAYALHPYVPTTQERKRRSELLGYTVTHVPSGKVVRMGLTESAATELMQTLATTPATADGQDIPAIVQIANELAQSWLTRPRDYWDPGCGEA